MINCYGHHDLKQLLKVVNALKLNQLGLVISSGRFGYCLNFDVCSGCRSEIKNDKILPQTKRCIKSHNSCTNQLINNIFFDIYFTTL